MPIVVDTSEFPLVRLTFPRELRLEDLDELHATVVDLHRTRGPMVTLGEFANLDLRTVTAMQRKRIAEQADILADRGGLIAEIVVLPSALYRAMFTGYSWMRVRKTHPQLAFATFDEAYAEAKKWVPAARAAQRAAASR